MALTDVSHKKKIAMPPVTPLNLISFVPRRAIIVYVACWCVRMRHS